MLFGAISWTITFSESVTRVGTADFTVDVGNIVGTIGISGSGASYTVTATLTAPSTQTSDLEIHLRTSANVDIQDASGNGFDTTPRNLTTGNSHYILNTGTPTPPVTPPTPPTTPDSREVIVASFMELSLSSIERQATQIITNTPTLSTRLSRSSGSIDNSNQSFTADVTNDYSLMQYKGNFISDLADIKLLGNAEFWTNLTYSSSNLESGAESSSFYSTTGIDVVAPSGVVWGLMVQLDMSDESQENRTELESFGWLTGPYAVYQSDGFSLSARAAIGASNADISPSPQNKGEYDTDRILLSAGISSDGYQYEGLKGHKVLYIPSLTYTYYNEELSDYTLASTSIVIPSTDYELNRLEFEHLFTRSIRYLGSTSKDTLTPSFGISGIYDTSSTSSSSSDTDDFKARIDAYLNYDGFSGIDWNASIYYEGIGEDDNTLGVSLGLNINY